MYTDDHGGECCGIKHIYTMGSRPTVNNTFRRFDGTSLECLKRAIESYDEERLDDEDDDDDDDEPRYNNGRVKEVVLADYQMNNGWPEALAELGFKKVASFLNSNSDNVCHVFYHHPNLTLYGDQPQPVVAPVAAPIERSAVLVEYFPNFRVGGRGRPFSSLQEVREHAPLVRRVDRRTVFSDGTIEWEDDVR